MKLSPHTLGITIGIGAVLSGSPVFVLVRVLGHSSAFTQVLCRSPYFLLVLCICMAYRWGSIEKTRSNLRSLGWKGIFACVFLASQSVAIFAALLLTRVSNVALLINTSPCFCALLDTFCLKEKTPKRTIVMIIFGLASVGIIIGGDVVLDPDLTFGNIVALINPISWAFYWAIVREHSKANPQLEKWDRLLALQVGSGVVIVIIGTIAYLVDPSDLQNTVEPIDWLWYFLLGGIVLPVCLLLFSLAPVYITTAEMGCIKMIETVLAPIYIYLYSGEEPVSSTYIGGIVLVSTIIGHSVAAIRDQSDPVSEKSNPNHLFLDAIRE